MNKGRGWTLHAIKSFYLIGMSTMPKMHNLCSINHNIFSVWKANNSTPYWMLCSNSQPNLVKKLLQRVMTEITSTLLKMVFMTYTRYITDIFDRTFFDWNFSTFSWWWSFQNIDGEEVKVASYDNKGSFGELALMYNAPRAATVTSVDGGTLWALDRQVWHWNYFSTDLYWIILDLY